MRDHIRLKLNGRPHIVRGTDAFAPATDFLRSHLGLCGTKVVCAEGDCGACTILVGRPNSGRLRYEPVDACIQFLYQLDATHVVTVEGLADNGRLHPAQQALVECHGSQCGYCTPGITMALAGWAEAGAATDVRVALTGNLCRCTGYLPIFDAAAAIAAAPPQRNDAPELVAELNALAAEPLRVTDGRRTFFAPTTLAEAAAFKADRSDAAIVAGGTELGVWRNKRGMDPPALLSLARIPGLNRIDFAHDMATVGANVTWTQIERELCPRLPALAPIVRRFGSPQIRNVATLVGNVANGSPIADALPLLVVLRAAVKLVGLYSASTQPIAGFYTGYKQKAMEADELIAAVVVPLPQPEERLRLYKVSRRFDLDIATFGAAVRVRTENGTIVDAAVAYSGVAPTVVALPRAAEFLLDKPFEEATFRHAGRIARTEVAPISDVRGGSDFRLQLAENVLTKFYFDEVSAETAVTA